jgi:hypothetical protein
MHNYLLRVYISREQVEMLVVDLKTTAIISVSHLLPRSGTSIVRGLSQSVLVILEHW